MNTHIKLADIAHARAGDKGNTSILIIAPNNRADYPALRDALTAARIGTHFGTTHDSQVKITPVDQLAAIVVAVADRLAGGVTRSPTTDPHGKTLSGHLLELMVPWPAPQSDDGTKHAVVAT